MKKLLLVASLLTINLVNAAKFELYNKTPNTIYYLFTTGIDYRIYPKTSTFSDIHENYAKTLKISSVPANKQSPLVEIKYNETDSPHLIIFDKKGDKYTLKHAFFFPVSRYRDLFLSWGKKDGQGPVSLYPQTGTFMGLSGKSASGQSLSHNLKKEEIIPQDINNIEHVFYLGGLLSPEIEALMNRLGISR